MNPSTTQQTLGNRLQQVRIFLAELPEAYLHQPPDCRWTIAEELYHLTRSNGGTGRLLVKPPEQLRETDQPPRSYNALLQEYRERYTATPASPPQNVLPDEVIRMSKTELTQQWGEAEQRLQQGARLWEQDRWDQYTVWKHPLLGPLTVREMLYFTIFHNEHHAEIMEKKYVKLRSRHAYQRSP